MVGIGIGDGDVTGALLDAGSGVLATISFTPSSLDISSCLTDAVIAFAGGVAATEINHPDECTIISSCANADQCGVCGGDNLTCVDCNNIPNGDSVCLSIENVNSDTGTFDIYYDSANPISGFQLDLSGFNILGGNTNLGSLTTQLGSDLVVGLGLNGELLPAGSGILVSVNFIPSNIDINACITDAIIVFEGGDNTAFVLYQDLSLIHI